jgi:hypothetical protein
MKIVCIGAVLLSIAGQAIVQSVSGQPKSPANHTDSTAPAEISGEYLKAFLVAYQDFKRMSDLPTKKKQIENYQIEFR